jgi:Tol biopolymer transport system component
MTFTGRACGWIAAATVVAAVGSPLVAKQRSEVREIVLKQIQLPHHYYYREMYLPQATTGPGSAAWSPDGREIVYSMQGSLWRQRPETKVAQQITSGPGYDYQPDWSPDGRFIAYASYRDDAVELWLLEAATGKTRPITRNGTVNVEPRFSPDGRRIAFVSTVFNKRFHIHTLTVGEDGEPGASVRLTEDHESGLPRYYYHPFDHFISPSWSPDGGEIVFVSNRGRIWGTGGFFRMKAAPGSEMREIRHEETTWKARPDWSPDGRRIAYSSYLGGQWHQLWLMTDEGGDVLPLTYGEFDATAPRWSRDGRHLAFISNQDGNTSLWTIEVPGGRRARVEPRERRYLGPVGRLQITVQDGRSGRTVAARLSVTGPDGRSFAADDAWRHADEAFDRSRSKFEYGYFHTPGASEVVVPAGPVTVEVLKGIEYRPVVRQVTVPAGGAVPVRITLQRIADLPSRGWFSGDLHVHMNYGGAYRNTPKHLAFQGRAEDLAVIENLVVNKEQRVPDIAYFPAGPAPSWNEGALVVHGQEYHTSLWGHTGILGPRDYFLMPAYAAYVNTAAASPFPNNPAVFDLAHGQGALTGYVHPFDTPPDPGKMEEPLTHDLPVAAALGKLDYFEVVGFSDHLVTSEVWYRLLNCGFRLPAGAGTDAMANYASLRGPVGVDRVYVKTGARPDHAAWLRGLRAGRTFATNGPLLEFSLGGKGIGDELRLPPGSHTVQARATLRSIVPIDSLQIIGNGRVVADLLLSGERTTATATRSIPITASGWYVLRAHAAHPAHPILDIYPFGTTSPIYVTVGDGKVHSRDDAAYFLAWIDRLEKSAREHKGWNTAAEKETVLNDFARAREVYLEQITP